MATAAADPLLRSSELTNQLGGFLTAAAYVLYQELPLGARPVLS